MSTRLAPPFIFAGSFQYQHQNCVHWYTKSSVKVFKGAVVRSISHSRHTVQMVWASDVRGIDSSATGVQKNFRFSTWRALRSLSRRYWQSTKQNLVLRCLLTARFQTYFYLKYRLYSIPHSWSHGLGFVRCTYEDPLELQYFRRSF